jgi:hypothetical protein
MTPKKVLWKEIHIGHSKYKIFKVNLKETDYDGLCAPYDYEILIDASLKGKRFTKVLLHEIRHAHHRETGLYEILGDQAQEMDCESFAGLVMSLGFKF